MCSGIQTSSESQLATVGQFLSGELAAMSVSMSVRVIMRVVFVGMRMRLVDRNWLRVVDHFVVHFRFGELEDHHGSREDDRQ